MGRKKDKGAAINLDSFLDIMTCLVGILVLIIILTGVDASQIKVLIPTPIRDTDFQGEQIFIEARNDELFLVPRDELEELAGEALAEISREGAGDLEKVMSLISRTEVTNEIYAVEMPFIFAGQLALRPIQTSKGYALKDYTRETENTWFGRIVTGMDKENQQLTFLVRDDSFGVFKQARALAWQEGVRVSWELLSPDDLIKFGKGGVRSFAQ